MQNKTLFPSGDVLADYLVMSVRTETDESPAALTVSGAAKVWLCAEGDTFAWYVRNAATGEIVRMEHSHANLAVLNTLTEADNILLHAGKKLAYLEDIKVQSVNGVKPDAAGNVKLDIIASGTSDIPPIPVPSDPDGDLLHLEVQFSASINFSSPVKIDTRTGRTGVYVFGSDQYEAFPAAGAGVAFYGSRVRIERPAAAANMKYARCRWYDGSDYTPWRALL